MAIPTNNLPKFFLFLLVVLVFSSITSKASTAQNTSLQDQILHSFSGTAHAESIFDSMGPPLNEGACYNTSFSNALNNPCNSIDETINICLKENTTNSFLAYYYLYAFNPPATLDAVLINPTSPLTITNTLLSSGTYISPAVPQNYTYDQLQYQFNVNAPAIPFASSPTIVASRLDGDFNFPSYGIRNLNDGINNGGAPPHNVIANIRAEHVNTAPSLTNLLPQAINQTLSGANQTVNIPASVNYNDAENNHSNVTFELSNDNFTTIMQSFTAPAVASGTTVNHTFTNLGLGSYRWRVSATETDAQGNCIGYPNADPPINLTFNSASHPNGVGLITISNGTTLAPTGDDTKPALAFVVLSFVAGIGLLSGVLKTKLFRRK